MCHGNKTGLHTRKVKATFRLKRRPNTLERGEHRNVCPDSGEHIARSAEKLHGCRHPSAGTVLVEIHLGHLAFP